MLKVALPSVIVMFNDDNDDGSLLLTTLLVSFVFVSRSLLPIVASLGGDEEEEEESTRNAFTCDPSFDWRVIGLVPRQVLHWVMVSQSVGRFVSRHSSSLAYKLLISRIAQVRIGGRY